MDKTTALIKKAQNQQVAAIPKEFTEEDLQPVALKIENRLKRYLDRQNTTESASS